jgi:mannose-6-phosphate isomerase-like protein (cupin superfamily)
MMKFWLPLSVFLTTAVSLMGGDGPSTVTYVDHEKVAAALASGGVLVNAPDLIVSCSHRTGPGKVELHVRETDVFHVLEGEATFVTGGTMVGSKETGPGQQLGTDIQGGQVHHLTKGDVIVIPAGTPHWFKEIPHSITYYVVKVVKP